MILPNVSHCIDQNDVHYNPIVPPIHNGHEYVDLGLPSGTLWATMNVGAEKVTDYGLYFAWGETQGYTASQVPSDKKFSWSDYKFNPSGDGSTMSKYNATDGKTVLDLEDDGVNVNWGGFWQMPIKEAWSELLNTQYVENTSVFNYNDSGVNGYLFTSVSNGNTLFIPMAGFYFNGNNQYIGNSCVVWSSSLNTSHHIYAYDLNDLGGLHILERGERYDGLPLRGVVNKSSIEPTVIPPKEEIFVPKT